MTKPLIVLLVGCALLAGMTQADPASNHVYDAYFLGFETDPAMDYGGRDVTTLHSALCRGIGGAVGADRTRFVAPVYEFFLAGGLSVVQHEIFGHGSRAREFNLDPEYGFGLDFSGWTSVGKDPADNEQNIMLAAGGTEGASVLSHRILRDLYTGDGTDGSKIPLMALTKLDFSLYCLVTPDPGDSPDDFADEYDHGNDIAYYLVSRQAQRGKADAGDVWNNDYPVDFGDPQLQDNYDELQQAAIWNLCDPAALSAIYGYAADHVIRGKSQVRPPVIPLGAGFGLTTGTRAFIGPEEVSRFLDFYWTTPGPLVTVYGRDLANPLDRTYGWGGGIYGIPVASVISFGLSGDAWQSPASREGLYAGSGWNAAGELDALLFGRYGLSCKAGSKSEGFFPGTPMASGLYAGAGLLVSF